MDRSRKEFISPFLVCWLKNSTRTALWIPLKNPEGIMLHSTGRNGKKLKNYIQPSKNDPEYDYLISKIGLNKNHNDYNHTRRDLGYHFWIGQDDNGNVSTIATEPLNIKTQNDNYIHICVCEDNLCDSTYFNECITNIVAVCCELCKYYNWDTSKIIDHSQKSNMPDISYWLKSFGYSIFLIQQITARMIDYYKK